MGQEGQKLLPQISSSCTQVIAQILIDHASQKGTGLAGYVTRLLGYVTQLLGYVQLLFWTS